jgi:flagellar hook-basal body complex protein FliE
VRVELLQPDAAPAQAVPPGDALAFGTALDAVGTVLGDATNAEDAYAAGSGSLQNAAYARAQADVALAIATAVAQRAAQAVQSLMNMQV